MVTSGGLDRERNGRSRGAMIEVMQLGEVRVPLGQAPVMDLAKDAAAFEAELDPAAKEGPAEGVPDASGLLVANPVAPLPDLRSPVELVPNAFIGGIAVPVTDSSAGGIETADGVAEVAVPPGVTLPFVAVGAPLVGENPVAGPVTSSADAGVSAAQVPELDPLPVPILAGMIDANQRLDPILSDRSERMQQRGADLPLPFSDPRFAVAVAQDVPEPGVTLPSPLHGLTSDPKTKGPQAEVPITPLPGSKVDLEPMALPGVALVVIAPTVPLLAFPLSRQMATEFRWSESVRLDRPVAAVSVPGSNNAALMPLGGVGLDPASLPGTAPRVEFRPGDARADISKSDRVPETSPEVAAKDLPSPAAILPADASALVLELTVSDQTAPDPAPPSLTPLQDIQQPLPLALRDVPLRIAPEVVTHQVAHLILSQAEDRAELLLDPAELGRLRFEITQRGEGVQIVVMAERPETMDLLRRHADQLLDDLQAMGFSGSALGFGHWDGPPQQTPTPLPDEGMVQMPLPAPIQFPVAPPPRGAAGGLNLRL